MARDQRQTNPEHYFMMVGPVTAILLLLTAVELSR